MRKETERRRQTGKTTKDNRAADSRGNSVFDSRPANKPKPNTRFLKHIIKDTDTHNKALLAKEAADSKARLEGLEQAEEAKRLKTNPNTRDIRRRQLGDIAAILGGGRRRSRHRDGDDEAGSGQASEEASSASKDRRGHSSSTRRDLIREERDDRRRHGRLERDSESGRSGHRHEDRHERRRGSDSEHGERSSKHRSRRDHDRSRSPGRKHRHDCHLSKSSETKQDRYRDRSPTSKRRGEPSSRRSERSPSPRRHRRRRRSPSHSPYDDGTDSSDDMVGPMPAPKPRGRGALTGSSGIDRRFSDSYDPKTDVQMDDDVAHAGQWDDAVEAFRDRQKMKQNQEARLRSAGFSESHIEKIQAATTMTRSGEKSEADVQWTKAGERREWDKGKVSEDEDGDPLTLLGEDA